MAAFVDKSSLASNIGNSIGGDRAGWTSSRGLSAGARGVLMEALQFHPVIMPVPSTSSYGDGMGSNTKSNPLDGRTLSRRSTLPFDGKESAQTDRFASPDSCDSTDEVLGPDEFMDRPLSE